jgi:glycosyltransferase involved in cell wall biosynthesis
MKFFGTSPDKIDVIYNSYDEQFGVEPREEDVNRVRERYQLQDEFVLYVGNVKPHKNVERLIEAFHLVRDRGLDHLKLVIIGDAVSKYAALRRAVHRHQLHKYVRFLGLFRKIPWRSYHWPVCSSFRRSTRGRSAAARGHGQRHPGGVSNPPSLPEVAATPPSSWIPITPKRLPTGSSAS